MNGYYFSTFRTDPSLFFLPDKMSDTELIDHIKIVDHTHFVICSVSFVQIFKSCARKVITSIGTVFKFAFGDLFAVFDDTGGPAR